MQPMGMIAPINGGREFRRQARVATVLGSPFVAAVLEAGQRQLRHAPRTAALFASWPRDPSADALAMRFNAALHALARRAPSSAIGRLYRSEHQDFDGAIAAALLAEDAFVAEWMLLTPQTNEVGRAAALLAALMAANRTFGLPFELLEIGASCGLNLNLAHYAYDLGGVFAGTGDSDVRIAPEWRGSPPALAPVEVRAARGVDLNPLQADDADTRERLLSYVWADQPQRAARLEQALVIARAHPPHIDQAGAATWLGEQLAVEQPAGLCRGVIHSMVLQYCSIEDRRTIAGALAGAGARATFDRPLVRIGFEWTPDRREVQLRLCCWPSGEERLLAICHAYGDWVQCLPD